MNHEEYKIDLQARMELFPVSAAIHKDAQDAWLQIGGCDLESLAAEYGTPLYIYDLETLNHGVDEYKKALAQFYPGQAGITYAGKAYLCTAIAQWTQKQELYLDCTGAGELWIAAEANLPGDHLVVHGVNKSLGDLQAALDQAGIIVVDNLFELERVASLCKNQPHACPQIWLRLRPGVSGHTHSYNQTGQEDSKFGLSQEELHQAVEFSLAEGLALNGLHFHLGSHFHDPAPYATAIEICLNQMAALRKYTGWLSQTLCIGGGWGVAYREADLPQPDKASFIQFVAEHLVSGCKARDLPLPRLQIEPGRSLAARAGVALYRVGATKQTAQRCWLLLDGGLADNPRPALYRARYSALPVQSPGRPGAGLYWLAGPYCESGDILIESLPMPAVQPGELVAVPASGAYQLSMASNYNGARKPAVVLVENGSARLIQRRETLDDLVRRDLRLA